MSRPLVVLVNSNEMKPPVAPLALDYLGGVLREAGFEVALVDLSFVDDALQHLPRALAGLEPLAVGVTFRNTDDCYLLSQASFVARLVELLTAVRAATAAPIVLGGCGFSIYPRQILQACGADYAIVGDPERSFVQLLEGMKSGGPVRAPGVLWRAAGGAIVAHEPCYAQELDVPTSRGLLDNQRYLREGAMGNVETKRGCDGACLYCADPVARGRRIRCRPPAQVADEIASLLAQGVDVLHLCDGEFNRPEEHALAVCEELISRSLGDRLRWYCYATVKPFGAELAGAMRRAGCVGVNFGIDSCSDRMLATLRRGYTAQDVRQAVDACRQAGIAVMLDLLLGGPGETPASVRQTIEAVKTLDPDCAGAATGLRIYPGTPLARQVAAQGSLREQPSLQGQLVDNDDLLAPIFYLEQGLGDDPIGLVRELIGGDPRFFPPPSPAEAASYNYNDNATLRQAIVGGQRGAFWDILRS